MALIVRRDYMVLLYTNKTNKESIKLICKFFDIDVDQIYFSDNENNEKALIVILFFHVELGLSIGYIRRMFKQNGFIISNKEFIEFMWKAYFLLKTDKKVNTFFNELVTNLTKSKYSIDMNNDIKKNNEGIISEHIREYYPEYSVDDIRTSLLYSFNIRISLDALNNRVLNLKK